MEQESETGYSLSRYQYYRQMVDQIRMEGGFDPQRQRPISQATLDFLIERKKDPISMLNIYCTASGEAKFDFYQFMIMDKGHHQFVYLTELDGHPVYGIGASNKKEAKKACALRLLDNLMAAKRLDCINERGRKIRRAPPKPLPVVVNMDNDNSIEEEVDNSNVSEQQWTQLSFAEDIDLDGMRQDFEKLNPMPSDWSEERVDEFKKLCSDAFRLHSENAFWREFQLNEQTKAKMAEFKGNSPLAFVKHCLSLADDQAQQDSGEEQQKQKPGLQQENPEKGQQKSTNESVVTTPKQSTLELVVFTLPYNPPRYACLARLDGQLHHGTISNSKQKAKSSCAEVLAQVCVERGWADIKAKKRSIPDSGSVKKKKRKEMSDQHQGNETGSGGILLEPHQYLLTLHPDEHLDGRTHFLLSKHLKNPVQLLNEIAVRERLCIAYSEKTDEATGKFMARVDSVDGAEWGCPEADRRLAISSAARKALDALVRAGCISISEQEEFAAFRSSMEILYTSLMEGRKEETRMMV